MHAFDVFAFQYFGDAQVEFGEVVDGYPVFCFFLGFALAFLAFFFLAGVVVVWRWLAAQQFFTVQGNIFPPLFGYPALVLLPVCWWVWRFVQGYRLLKAQQGIANPFSPMKVRPSP